jgi:hypothetical protein
MVVMGRLSRAIEGVPSAAMRRIAPWFSSLLAEAMKEPPHPELAEPKWGGAQQGQAVWPATGGLAQATALDYQAQQAQANGAKKAPF